MRDKKFIQEFTPNWFTVTMGTGATSLVINQFSHTLPFLWWIGMLLWALNIVLFLVFLTLLTLRFVVYPTHVSRLFLHSHQPLFLGCIAMGLVTIVDGFRVFGVDILGAQAAIIIAICLWWVCVALGLIFSWAAFLSLSLMQKTTTVPAVAIWLLPMVACEVAASSGALLIPHMSFFIKNFAFVLCIALWAFSVLLSLGIIALIFNQFIQKKIPDEWLAPSAWLILGPIGNGMLGLMTLGDASQYLTLPPSMTIIHEATQMFSSAGLIGAMMLWGLGTWWLFVAISISIRGAWLSLKFGADHRLSPKKQGAIGRPNKINFTLSWWTLTFPLAMYTLGTLAISKATQANLFLFFGLACAVLLVILWLLIAGFTLVGALNQTLFYAPGIHQEE